MSGIIDSILNCDIYKFYMGNLIFDLFPNVQATYKFKCRNAEEIDFFRYVDRRRFEEEIRELANLKLTDKEADYLRSLNLFSEGYIKFLMNDPLNPKIEFRWCYENGNILKPYPVVSGNWAAVMLYEIFCLSIANELYSIGYKIQNDIPDEAVRQCGLTRLNRKIYELKEYDEEIKIIEFGTRRRLSNEWQREVVEKLVSSYCINSTSNVKLAMDLGITPVGSMAHEYIMGMQSFGRIQDSQKNAFLIWSDYYKGKLGIALTDTLGTDKFLKDFDSGLAQYYSGLRHDSGDPVIWGNSMIRMYEKFGINPKTKTLMFSDGLNMDKAVRLHKTFRDRINVSFGIGTDLTNDTFIPTPQVVMKITECDIQPVAKISDNSAKSSCIDEKYLDYLIHVCENY